MALCRKRKQHKVSQPQHCTRLVAMAIEALNLAMLEPYYTAELTGSLAHTHRTHEANSTFWYEQSSLYILH